MLRYYTQPRAHLPPGTRATRVQPPPPPAQAPPTLSLAAIQTAFQRSTTLFLTRRLPPALETLQPVLPYTNKCVRSLRVKIWSTYFAILDAVLKLEGPEGKTAFGSLRAWREVKNRVRKAKIWDELLATYGDPGRAEVEVVTAAITLLVRHTQDYAGLQVKIESYLAAAGPVVDLKVGQKRAREQLLEMYTLIVLPGVGDWGFAREFIEGNDDLGDISKAEILDTLDHLQREQEEEALELEHLKAIAEEEATEEDESEHADDRSETYSTRPSTPVEAPEEDDPREIIFDHVEPTTEEPLKPSHTQSYSNSHSHSHNRTDSVVSVASTTKSANDYTDFALLKPGKSSLARGQFSRVADIFATIFSLCSRISESAPLPKYFRQAIFLIATVYWLSTSLAARGTGGTANAANPKTAQAKRDKKSAMRALGKAKKWAVMSWWWLGGGKGLGYV